MVSYTVHTLPCNYYTYNTKTSKNTGRRMGEGDSSRGAGDILVACASSPKPLPQLPRHLLSVVAPWGHLGSIISLSDRCS